MGEFENAAFSHRTSSAYIEFSAKFRKPGLQVLERKHCFSPSLARRDGKLLLGLSVYSICVY